MFSFIFSGNSLCFSLASCTCFTHSCFISYPYLCIGYLLDTCFTMGFRFEIYWALSFNGFYFSSKQDILCRCDLRKSRAFCSVSGTKVYLKLVYLIRCRIKKMLNFVGKSYHLFSFALHFVPPLVFYGVLKCFLHLAFLDSVVALQA